MKRIYSTTSLEEAQALCVALRGEGIEPLLDNEHAAFSAVEMPTSAIPLGILVRDEEAGRAALLIHDLRRKETGPLPVATEEDRRFAKKVDASRRSARWKIAIAFLTLPAVTLLAVAASGSWVEAGTVAGVCGGVLLTLGLIERAARRHGGTAS